jgi:hypothetical protein
MKPLRAWLLAVSGIGLIIAGIAMVNIPAAFIVAGAAALAAGLTVDWEKDG